MVQWQFSKRILTMKGRYSTVAVRPIWKADAFTGRGVDPTQVMLSTRMDQIRRDVKPMSRKKHPNRLR